MRRGRLRVRGSVAMYLDSLVLKVAEKLLERGLVDRSTVEKTLELIAKLTHDMHRISPYIDEAQQIVAFMLALLDSPKYRKNFPELVSAYNYFHDKLSMVKEWLHAVGHGDIADKYNTTALAVFIGAMLEEVYKYITRLADAIIAKYLGGRRHVNIPLTPQYSSGDVAAGLAIAAITGRVTNIGVISTARKIFEKVKEAVEYVLKSLRTTIPAGVPMGVRPIQSLEEIPYLTPEEQAFLIYDATVPELSDYGVYRIISGQAMVYERKGIVKPVVFIDKSGSMSSPIITPFGPTTRYAMAAAIAAGIIDATSAPVDNVYLFDWAVYPLAQYLKAKKDVINGLKSFMKKYKLKPSLIVLSVIPGGGTSINNVYQTIEQLKRQGYNLFVIVTDAEDAISHQLVDNVMKLTNGKVYSIVINERLDKIKGDVDRLKKSSMPREKVKSAAAGDYAVYISIFYPDKAVLLKPHVVRDKELRRILSKLQEGVATSAIPA